MKITPKIHHYKSPQPPASIIVTSKNAKYRPKKWKKRTHLGRAVFVGRGFSKFAFANFEKPDIFPYISPLTMRTEVIGQSMKTKNRDAKSFFLPASWSGDQWGSCMTQYFFGTNPTHGTCLYDIALRGFLQNKG